ncbi:MAG: Ig-like domain-containing protein [Candidatus Rifleibacteriota bacterium]
MENRKSLLFFFILLILFSGCSFFDLGSENRFDESENASSLIFRGETTGSDLNFNSNDFSLMIPGSSISSSKTLQAMSFSRAGQFPGADEFNPISLSYLINFETGSELMYPSAQIGFNPGSGYPEDQLFALSYSDADGWLIHGHSFRQADGKLVFSTPLFSSWLLAARTNPQSLSPAGSPIISASPSILLTDTQGYPEGSISIHSKFVTFPGNFISNLSHFMTIQLLARKGFSVKLTDPDGQSRKVDAAIDPRGFYVASLDALSDNLISKELSGNTASATAKISFADQKTDILPEFLVLRAIAGSVSRPGFTRSTVILLKKDISKPVEPPAKAVPALEAAFPAPGSNLFSTNEILKFSFNKPINRESFQKAFSIFPSPDMSLVNFKWNESGSEISIENLILQGATAYKIIIGKELTDLEGNSLEQNIEIGFTTRETDPPQLLEFYPDSATTLPVNGSLVFRFSEIIASETFKLNLVPEANLDYSFNDNLVTVSNKNTWTSDTIYQVTLLQGLSDKLGNKTSSNQLLTFTTSALIAPRIVSFVPVSGSVDQKVRPSIEVHFDQIMNHSVVEAAISIQPSASMVFSWSDKVLKIEFNQDLEYGKKYEITINSNAESATGATLSNKYFFNFTTINRPQILVNSVLPSSGEQNIASDSIIAIPFNRLMNRPVTEGAFSLVSDTGSVINGNFSWSGSNLNFTPAGFLKPGGKYKIVVGAEAEDANGNKLGQQFSSLFSVALNAETYVTAFNPIDGNQAVPFDQIIKVFFSGPVKKETFSFSIEPSVSGRFQTMWGNSDREASISFESGLTGGTSYLLKISDSVQDIFDRKIKSGSILNFATQAVVKPRVMSTEPQAQSTGILPNSSLLVNFSEPMNRTSAENSISTQPPSTLAFSWSNNDSTVKINPASLLAFDQKYYLIIGSSAVNLDGQNLIKDYQIDFTTRAQTFVKSFTPASGAVEIGKNALIEASFSAKPDQSMAESAFFASYNSTKISGVFSWNNNLMTFKPDNEFGFQQQIIAGFNGNLNDQDGLPVLLPGNWSFTTLGEAPPVISSSNPINGQTEVGLNPEITVQFSTKMATSTVIFSITPSPGNFTGIWDQDGRILTIKGLFLSSNTGYQLNFSNESQSLAGKKLAGAVSIAFNTANFPGPAILSTVPEGTSENISTISDAVVKFDRPINKTSAATAISITPASLFNLEFSDSDRQITIKFASRLQTSTEYKIQISKDLTDTNGLKIDAPYSFTFKTETFPSVVKVTPMDLASGIATTTAIILDFNKEMDPAATQSSFRLSSELNTISCSFTWENAQRLVCTPVELFPGRVYQVSLTTNATDKNGNKLTGNFSSSFTTVPPPAFNAQFIQPVDGLTNAPYDQIIIASFSNPVKTETLLASFSPAPPSGYNISWSTDKKALSIKPNGNLNGGQTYQIKILKSLQDIHGSSLASDQIVSFTTAPFTAPEIIQTQPAAGSFEVPLDQSIVITFNHEMDTSSTQNAYSISPSAGIPSFSWSSDRKNMTVTYSSNFSDATSYQVKIASSARDINQTAMANNYLLPFQTIARPELLISKLSPADGATQIVVQTQVKMVFSKTMNLQSIKNAFSMKAGTTPISGDFTQSSQTVVFTPSSALLYDQNYSLNLNSSAYDLSGNYIKAPVNWSFKTAPEQGKVWVKEVAQTEDTSMFSSRIDHTMINLGGDVYVIGGFDGSYLNDVWKSSDGKNWSPVLSATAGEGTYQFSPRAGHACVVHDGYIWLTGGYYESDTGKQYFDDVWYSNNGSKWYKKTGSADYYQRAYHSMASFNGSLWVVAGETQDSDGNPVLLDECWKSDDGISWTLMSKVVSFFPRKRSSTVSFSGKMWVFGGYGGSTGIPGALNDIWNTTNGDVWQKVSSSNVFTPRCCMAQVVYSNKIWLIGGSSSDSSGTTLFNDVWASSDGINWYEILAGSGGTPSHFSPRTFLMGCELPDKMLISGGLSAGGNTNEVWSSK